MGAGAISAEVLVLFVDDLAYSVVEVLNYFRLLRNYLLQEATSDLLPTSTSEEHNEIQCLSFSCSVHDVFGRGFLEATQLPPDAVGTICNQRVKKVEGTEHSIILRVPFRNEKGILRKWISRFEVWPYLETFTEDVAKEIVEELQTKPDLIIGNYSDGNLVETLLAHKLGVTQCTIAHALEKTKYPNSDLY